MREVRTIIINKTKGKLPKLPFSRMARPILGLSYALEVAFVGPSESRLLNRHYRGKNKPATVLSFPFSQREGTIVLCQSEARREMHTFGYVSPTAWIGYLFIHGLLHLKGRRHGSTMEAEEKRWCAKFIRS
jgi:rRNA maturation RNase YbeY